MNDLLEKWDRDYLFLAKQIAGEMQTKPLLVCSQEAKRTRSSVLTKKKQLQSLVGKIQALALRPSSYLSPQGLGVLRCSKVFGEKLQKLVQSYWILWNHMFWVHLVLCRLSGSPILEPITDLTIEFCGKKIQSGLRLRTSQRRKLHQFAQLRQRLEAEVEALELIRLNRQAAEFKEPFLISSARRLFLSVGHK